MASTPHLVPISIPLPLRSPTPETGSGAASTNSSSPTRPPSSTAVPLRFSRRTDRRSSRRTRSDSPAARTRRDGGSDAGEGSRQRSRRRARRQSKRQAPGLTKRLELVEQLARSLDSLVLVQLAALYYLECNFFLLAPRALVHYFYFTPQPESMIMLTTAEPGIIAIIIPNLAAILYHIFASLPEPDENSHGYMHGGVFIDFIGQQPPKHKWVLLAFNILIALLQCLMLSVHFHRDMLRHEIDPVRSPRLRLLRLLARSGSVPPAEALAMNNPGLAGATYADNADPTAEGFTRRSSSSGRSTPGSRASSSRPAQPDLSEYDGLVTGTEIIGVYNPIETFRSRIGIGFFLGIYQVIMNRDRGRDNNHASGSRRQTSESDLEDLSPQHRERNGDGPPRMTPEQIAQINRIIDRALMDRARRAGADSGGSPNRHRNRETEAEL